MSRQDDLAKAILLIKSDTDLGLDRRNGTFASWVKPYQTLTYYIWTGSETSDDEVLLASGIKENFSGITVLKSATSNSVNITNAMNYLDGVLNLDISAFTSSPANSQGEQQVEFLFAGSTITTQADLAALTAPSVAKRTDNRTTTAIVVDVAKVSPSKSQLMQHTFTHEALHGIGLFDAYKTGLNGTKYDNFKYTITSYNQHESFAVSQRYTSTTGDVFNLPKSVFPTSLMLLDYLALHEKGLLSDYEKGDNLYHWNDSDKILHTIYDVDGIDTISVAEHQRGAIIDLRDGHFSSLGSTDKNSRDIPVENLAIAYDTFIEKAIGGAKDDVLIGNDIGNELKGEDGNDFIYGNGADYKTEGWGFSQAHKDAYKKTVDNSTLKLDDNDTLYGGKGYDYISGGSGLDKLFGDADADHLDGGTEADELNGGDGNDILEGGSGNDTYLFTGAFGRDMIKDSDHNGILKIDHATLTSEQLLTFKQTVTGGIVYRNEHYQAVKINEGISTSLIISSLADSNNSITIKNWEDNTFGITFDAPDAQNQDPLYTGTFPDNNSNANVVTLDEFFKTLPDTDTKAYTQIIANGGAGTDFLQGTLNGSDTLNGGADDDIITGGNKMFGAGFDTQVHMLDYLDQQGTDLLNGDAGKDYIVVSGKNSVAHGGIENDIIRADEYLWGDIKPYEADAGVSAGDDYDVSVDNVWADFRKFLNPHTLTGATIGATTFNTTKTSNAWQAAQSTTGLNYYFLQRPDASGALVATTHYGNTAPGFGTAPNGDWSINGSQQIQWLTGIYLSIPNLNIANYQHLQGQNLFGDEGDDLVIGSIMSDYISGGQGMDTLLGMDGHDIIDGGSEIDTMKGGTGNDTLIGGDGNDILDGNGFALLASQRTLPDNDILYGGDGGDTLSGEAGDDYLDGGTGTDTLFGDEGKDYLYGGDDDVKDKLNGGKENDILIMGKSDVAGGSAGDDTYIWDTHQITKKPVRPAAALANANTASETFANNVQLNNAAPQADAAFIIDNEGNNTLALIGGQDLSTLAFSIAGDNMLINADVDQQIIIQGGVNSAPVQIITGVSVEQIASSTIQFSPITDDTFLNGSDLLAQPQINTAGLMLSNLHQVVTATAATANNYLAGGLVNDTLTANSSGTTFIGGRGDDTLTGEVGNDTYLIRAGDGNDTITEKGGINSIKLDAAITASQATTPLSVRHVGADLLISISDEQTITVKNMFDATTGALVDASSVQNILFYDNTSWDITKIKQQTLISTASDDAIGGSELTNVINGGKGNDRLSGGAGSDIYQYALGDGNDIIIDTSGIDRIVFTGGVAQSQVTAFRDGYNNLVLRMTDGAIITVTGAFDSNGNLTTNALENIQFSDITWNSTRIQQEVNNYTGHIITDAVAANSLVGDAGKDIFIGGAGNDVISGDAGDDIYRYALGDGNDVITDTAGVDRIELTSITQAQVVARSSGNDLMLTLTDGGTVTVKDMFANKSQTPVDPIITSVIQNLQSNWISQAETLIEDNYGLVGSGDITLKFQHGIAGAEAAHVDIFTPVDGNFATALELSIDLDDFSVSPNGKGALYYDRIIAHEMVHAVMARSMNMSNLPGWFTEGAAEFIHGADERVKSDMAIIGDATNFNLLFKTTAGSPPDSAGYSVSYIAVKLLDGEIRANGGAGIKDLFAELKTGKTLDQSLAALSTTLGGMGGLWNNLASFETHFQTVGFASMDTLLNLNDADTGSIIGSDYGNAPLDPYAIVSNKNTGASLHFNLVIPAQYINSVGVFNEIETIQFADGVWDAARILQEMMSAPIIGTDSNDGLVGTDGNEMLIGHKSNDTLKGGNGNDVYQYEMGDGWDYITETAGIDTIQFGASISESDVTVYRYFNELRVLLSNGEYVTVKNMFDMATDEIIPENAIEKIQFANGNVWDINRIQQEITKGIVLQGTAGYDYFEGSFANDTLNGNGGEDYLYSFHGDDILNGGAGNDSMGGGLGNDILNGGIGDDSMGGDLGDDLYQFAPGDGSDVISEAGGVDTIKFAPGIPEANVVLRRSQANLIIGLSTGEKITVARMFDAVTGATISDAAIEKIEFSNGNVWDLNRIQQEIVKPLFLQGTDGVDNLVGSDLNDTLIGGKSNDSLSGLYGDDTYQINLGDGVDGIVDSGGVDSIKFGAGIFEGNVSVSRYGLIITPNTGEQRIAFDYTAIEKVEFANGNIWDAAYIQTEAIKGTAGNDEIRGFNTNEVFAGGKGNDTIYGSGGDDTYIFNRGDGNDRIRDDVGLSTIRFGSGIIESDVTVSYDSWGVAYFLLNTGERLSFGLSENPEGAQVGSVQFASGASWDPARIYRESIKGSSGINYIYSFSGNDTINGGAGADTIDSGAGNDVISGGTGFDSLRGDTGDDTYQFARGDGVDNIKDTGGADTIQFLAGILPSDVSLIKVEQNLFISIANSNNSIQVTNEFLNAALNPSSAIEKITFLDGTIWGSTMIQQKIVESTQNPALIVGGNYGDEIHLAGTTNYLIYGMEGNDDISGGDGNDRIVGGNGINILNGGKGNNTYFVNDDAGTQIITSFANLSGQTNRILFSDAVSKDDVQVRLAPRHPVSSLENGSPRYYAYESSERNILLTSNGQSVYLAGDFRYGPYAAQDFGFVEFSDGTKWDINELLRLSIDTTAPTQPTAQFSTTGKYITGVAEGGSIVSVKNTNGVEIGTGTAYASNGFFEIRLATALINYESVSVTAKDAAGNISVARSINAPLIDVTQPAQPTAEFDPTGKIIFGEAEAGTKVSVKNANAVELGAIVANATTGAYSITLVTALINTETVNVTAKDAAGNISVAKTIIAPLIASGDTISPIPPTAAFDPAGKIIFGKAEAGSTVSVKNASAVELGTIVAHATTGVYSITLPTALMNTETVNVTAKDAAGNISVAKTITAPDLTAPLQPTADFNTAGTIITGNAEKSSRVHVYNAANVSIGNIKASSSTGNYTITLATPLTRGETVKVIANDAAGNLSVAKTITAPVLTAASAASFMTVKMSAPSSATAQVDALIQAMAAFAPPTAAQTKTLIGYYDNNQPMLASHG
jgi:Ca2+-binding RTX toxin-like protein